LSKPHIVLATPTGIAATTAGTTHLHSDAHTAVTTGQHQSLAVQGSWFATVLGKIAVVATKAITLISRKGPIRVEAQADMIELVAQKVLNLLSNDDWVTITGKKGILLNGEGSYLRLTAAGVVLGTAGTLTTHSVSSNFDGPQSLSTASRAWSDGRYNDKYVVKHPRSGEPLENVRYRLTHEDGSAVEGLTDSQGHIPLQHGVDPSAVRIALLGIKR
jgi:type VI secretion system secreted protein VgrG